LPAVANLGGGRGISIRQIVTLERNVQAFESRIDFCTLRECLIVVVTAGAGKPNLQPAFPEANMTV
jgi:hypothetical protein